jgi:hypothetical protein
VRTIVLVVAAWAALSFTSTHVRADGAWCSYYVQGGTNCGFHSYEQCMANISGIGGILSAQPELPSVYRLPRAQPAQQVAAVTSRSCHHQLGGRPRSCLAWSWPNIPGFKKQCALDFCVARNPVSALGRFQEQGDRAG